MIPYWLLFAFFTFGAVLEGGRATSARRTDAILVFGAVMCALMIGLRYEVGADWISYRFIFNYAGFAELGRALSLGDPAFQLINWLAKRAGMEIWVVNLISGAIFCWGLYKFARGQPSPWLAFVIAVPYLIIVVAMGYTRQAVAIGIIMAGLASLQRHGSIIRFAAYVFFAALFHRTAVFVFPLAAFAVERNILVNWIVGLASTLLLYDLFLARTLEQFVQNYIVAKYLSQGALVRVVMNAIPAAIFLIYSYRLSYNERDRKCWRNFSLVALGLLVMLAFFPSSTAVDRLALYIIPLQVVVFSRLPVAFGLPGLLCAAAIVYAFLVQFVWLNYAVHAEWWLPYRVFPLVGRDLAD